MAVRAVDQADIDFKTALQGIERRVVHAMPAREIVQILSFLDSATFVPELKKLLQRLHNDPVERIAVLDCLTSIMRRAERMRDKRESERTLVGQMAVGGGTGLLIGGVVALLNSAIGILGLVVAGGGMMIGGAPWVGARRLDDERSAYKQMADRLLAILKAVE